MSDPPMFSGASPGPSTDTPVKVSHPITGQSRFVLWIVLAACLLAAMPALLVDIQRPQVTNHREALTLATSIGTWQRHRSISADQPMDPSVSTAPISLGIERLVPYLNDAPQLQNPPATTWIHLLAFSSISQTVKPTIEHLILRARLASVLFTLITIAAVFWAGQCIGRTPTAAMAALVCGANPVLIYHGRLATPAVAQVAVTMVSIAAALWAIRPLRPAPSVERQFVGWVTSGLALAAAILTSGPWSILYICVPVLVILILCPARASHLMGLLVALLLGVLLVGLWLLYADERDPQVYLHWKDSLVGQEGQNLNQLLVRGSQRMGMLLAVMLPWTLWMIGAVVQPFSTSSGGARLRMLLGWVWFAAGLMLLILNPMRVRLEDQLIMLPASAILIGQLFHQYGDLAGEGRYVRFWRLLRWPYVLILMIGSVGLPALLYLQTELANNTWLPGKFFATSPWYFGGGVALILLVVVMVSLRWTLRHYPARALVCWAIWVQLLLATMAIPLARGPAMRSAAVADAGKLNALAGDRSVYYINRGDGRGNRGDVDPVLLLYTQRMIATVASNQIDQLIKEEDRFVIIVPAAHAAPIEDVSSIGVLESVGLKMWQYPARVIEENGDPS